MYVCMSQMFQIDLYIYIYIPSCFVPPVCVCLVCPHNLLYQLVKSRVHVRMSEYPVSGHSVPRLSTYTYVVYVC